MKASFFVFQGVAGILTGRTGLMRVIRVSMPGRRRRLERRDGSVWSVFGRHLGIQQKDLRRRMKFFVIPGPIFERPKLTTDDTLKGTLPPSPEPPLSQKRKMPL